MKQKRYSEEQIIAVLKQAEMGVSVGDVVRKLGISEQTLTPLYVWYFLLQLSGLKRFDHRDTSPPKRPCNFG